MSDQVNCEKGSSRDYHGEAWTVIYYPSGDDFRLVLGESDETEIDCIPVEAMRQLQEAVKEGFRDRKARRLRRGVPDPSQW